MWCGIWCSVMKCYAIQCSVMSCDVTQRYVRQRYVIQSDIIWHYVKGPCHLHELHPHHGVSISFFPQPNSLLSCFLFTSLLLSSPCTTDGNEKKYSVESRRTFQIIALLSKFFTANREVISEVKNTAFLFLFVFMFTHVSVLQNIVITFCVVNWCIVFYFPKQISLTVHQYFILFSFYFSFVYLFTVTSSASG